MSRNDFLSGLHVRVERRVGRWMLMKKEKSQIQRRGVLD